MITSIIVSFSPSLAFADDSTSSDDGSRDFIVTAYYSPLPDQSVYIRGSYEADKRLNGNGTNGASGHEVYPGMLAGPKTYAFGTKIYFDGIGIGTIDDRGGAIIPAGSGTVAHDRIDIWMGSGEDGLARALTFGRRTLHGRVVSSDEAGSLPTLDITSFPAGHINRKKYRARKTSDPADPSGDPIFEMPVDSQSDVLTILRLEQVFSVVGYYG